MESTGGKPGFKERILKWFISRRAKAGVLSVLLVVGIFLLAQPAAALGLEDLGKWALGFLGTVLNVIIEFLGKLIILLTNVLIEFASYNNFVNAPPVQTGWVLMRDVVNMFFIVVLLVSAFSTIIGYSEFHYTKVLPKLLLMAVLINFSKTLIGLLIDFSQVLMLTFVNAFKPAAGGNFINLLKLSKATNLRTDLENADSQSLVGLLVASMLAIFMLTIVLTILVIMIAFIIYRIIGLWMILIMSPMAFFALALPGKMAKGVAPFTGKFWERLSSFLIGGPVMAFFIWLALAIAQGGSGFNDLYNRQSTEVTNATSEFVNEIGKPEEIASFIVAIAFLLAGVEFAVSTANAISPTLGSFAKGVSKGGGAIINIPRYAARITGKTARVGAGVAQRGFGAADFATGGRLRGAIGKAGLAASSKLGGVGAATFADMATYKARKIKSKQAAMAKVTADLDPATRDAYLRGMASSSVFSKDAAAAQISLATSASSSPGIKARTKLAKQELDELNKKRKGDEKWSEADITAMSEAMGNARAAEDVKIGKAMAEKIGDDANAGKFKDAIDKNPILNSDWKDFAKIKGQSVEDVKEFLKHVSADSVKDGRVAIANMHALGLIEDGKFVARDGEHKETWDALLKGDRGKYIQKHLEAYGNDPQAVIAMLAAMDGDKDSIKAADAARHFVAKDSRGVVGAAYYNPGDTTKNVKADVKVTVRNEGEIAAAQQRLSGISNQNSPEAFAERAAMLGAGATLAQAFAFNGEQGSFAGDAERKAYEAALAQVDAGLKEYKDGAVNTIATFDTDSLRQNAGGFNEARQQAALAISNDALIRGYEEAGNQKNQGAQAKISEIVDLIDMEAKRLEAAINKLGVSREEIINVAVNPTSASSKAIISRLESNGVAEAATSARVVSRGYDLRSNEKAWSLRNSTTSRAAASIARAPGAAAAAAKTLKEKRAEAKQERYQADLERRADNVDAPDIEPPRPGSGSSGSGSAS